MDWSFLRREWGAVSFVLTVIVGLVVVPLALYFGNRAPTPVGPAPGATSSASPARTAAPASPSPSPSR